jgi:hypothetical protein
LEAATVSLTVPSVRVRGGGRDSQFLHGRRPVFFSGLN